MSEEAAARRGERVLESLRAFASGQSDLGRQFARHIGLPTTDSAAVVEILRAEERGQPLTPARLAERVGLTSGATSILLNRLEDAGHIVRARGHRDRRVVTLHSTTSVHDTADAFFAPLGARLDAVTTRYTAEQLDLVDRFVTELRETIDDHRAPRDGAS